ncbi:MAG TPA: GNAT family N-acetyltransferase [Fimbriimonadaceae bacterium]|nr:GNAT family N-acetyltransferase [Fimbriimonadaceae bacterium]
MAIGTTNDLFFREPTADDFEAICAIRNLTLSEPITPEVMAERERNLQSEGMRRRLVACREGRVVATGQATRWPGMPRSNCFLTVDVEPSFRRQGIGTRLLTELAQLVAPEGCDKLTACCRDDRHDGKAFLEARGFEFSQHLVDSELHLTTFSAEPFEAIRRDLDESGIQLVDFLEFGDTAAHRRLVHELSNTCDADTPGIEQWGLPDYERFAAETFESSRYHPAGLVLAAREGMLIGLSWIAPVGDGAWGTHFSGVLPPYRGRGIALACKAKALANAKALGAKVCRAQNDTRNGAMLRINERLGFVPQFGWIYMTRRVST